MVADCTWKKRVRKASGGHIILWATGWNMLFTQQDAVDGFGEKSRKAGRSNSRNCCDGWNSNYEDWLLAQNLAHSKCPVNACQKIMALTRWRGGNR